nr:hypothetical protein [Tanacetum cinerariifolium]
MNVQPTLEPIIPPADVNAKEMNTDQAKNVLFKEYELINPFTPPGIKAAECSSCNVDMSNMHTFYQRHRFNYHWTRDHPLDQVQGNPSKHVQTKRKLAIDLKMCMFAPIEHVDKPFGKIVINLKWLWNKKKDEDNIAIYNKARLVEKWQRKVTTSIESWLPLESFAGNQSVSFPQPLWAPRWRVRRGNLREEQKEGWVLATFLISKGMLDWIARDGYGCL